MIPHLGEVNSPNTSNTGQKWQYLVEIISYPRRKFKDKFRSKTVSEFNSSRLYEIYAHTMSSLASGEIKQLIAKSHNKFVNGKVEKRETFNLMM